MDAPRMPDPRSDEPMEFASWPDEVQDAYVRQMFGGGLAAGVARSFLLYGEGGDLNPPVIDV